MIALEPVSASTPRPLSALPPLSLYVHIPWCVRKCPYCDFNSHEQGNRPGGEGIDPALEQRYIAALLKDLDGALPDIWGRRIQTVFFGGGTPSLLSAHALYDLLSGLRARLPLSADAEVTLEANPGTYEAGKFREFHALGINRLSIGVQSFDDAFLRALGRIHNGGQARAAVESAARSFDNFNLDLMYALPGQSLSQALADVESALAMHPTHLSCYHLTIEPNTVFAKYPPAVPDDDSAADMQEAIETRLHAAGFENYETSAFARPGRRCRHNLNYWCFGDYLGLGAGAHGKISFPERIVRQARHRAPADYLRHAEEDSPVATSTVIAVDDLPFEFMMNALRLSHGFEARLFEERTGLNLAAIIPILDRSEADGLIVRDHLRIAPTAKGQRFLNDVLQRFLR